MTPVEQLRFTGDGPLRIGNALLAKGDVVALSPGDGVRVVVELAELIALSERPDFFPAEG